MIERLSKDANISENNLKSQLPRNLLSNIIYFIVSIVIGIVLIPYFISSLGVAAYGLIPLATAITGYVAIVVQSLNTAVSRFLTIDLRREDYEAANSTFNTALFGFTALTFIMIPIALAVAWNLPHIFHIPSGIEDQAISLFLGVCASFLIRSWTGNFTIQLFAFNRLDLQSLINLINLLVQTGLIVLLFNLFGSNLALIGYAYVIGAIIASAASVFLSRRICPYLIISIKSFKISMLRDICEMGGWIVINQIGFLLFVSIDLIVVNLIFGASPAGNYAIALQWSILLRAVGTMLSGVLTPTILTFYARKEDKALLQITKSAVKLMGLAMALPVGLVCGLAPEILTVWVGEEFTNLAALMIILTGTLSVNLAVLPLTSITVAHNKVRIPGSVTLIMGMMNIILALALSLYSDWGYYGVAIAGAIVLTAKNAFFTPWYTAKVMGINADVFIRAILFTTVATAFVGISAWMLKVIIFTPSFLMLIIIGFSITVIYVAAIWRIGLNEFEKMLFKSYIPVNLKYKK